MPFCVEREVDFRTRALPVGPDALGDCITYSFCSFRLLFRGCPVGRVFICNIETITKSVFDGQLEVDGAGLPRQRLAINTAASWSLAVRHFNAHMIQRGGAAQLKSDCFSDHLEHLSR